MKINRNATENKNAALVTVAIPVYNAMSTLMPVTQSIGNQDYDNLEILLINDGSTDGSEKLCKSLSDEFSFINTINIEHSGVSVARNTAIDVAKGEYIAFVDCDDIVEPNYISTLMKLIVENPNSIPVCGIELRDCKSGELIEQRKYAEENRFKSPSEFIGLYTSGLFSSPCNKLYRPQILKSRGVRFNTSITTGEDLLFNLRYLRECRGFIVDNSPLYIYNVAESGRLHTRHDETRFEEIKTMAKALMGALKTFRTSKGSADIISLKLLDEYMQAFRLFCIHNENTSQNRKIISDVMKTEEFKFAFKAIKNSEESTAYKNILRLKNAHLLMKYFSRYNVSNSGELYEEIEDLDIQNPISETEEETAADN